MIRIFPVSVVIFLIISAGYIYSGEAQQTSKTFKVSGGGLLKISLVNGDVNIRTWDNNEVKVRMDDLGDMSETDSHLIKIYQSGNTVFVENKGGGWSNSNDVSVSIPKEFNIDVKTNQGDVELRSDVTGKVTVFTGGGDISAKNITGQSSLSSYGGDIYADNLSADANISTKGGDIKLGNVAGNADLNTLGGSIDVGNVLKDLNARTNGGEITTGDIGGKLTATTMGGEIDIRNVSQKASVKTNGGNIKLSGSSGPVKAVTLGGNIDLYKISGPVEAKTYAGDVHVELESVGNSPSDISTLSGRISLFITSSGKATVKAKAGAGSFGPDEKAIVSDFSPESYETGKYSGFTNATYILNGGGPQITLKTLNGEIKINKLR